MHDQELPQVKIVKIEPKDRYTEEMCITENGTRIPRRYVYATKPVKIKVQDIYGSTMQWSGKEY